MFVIVKLMVGRLYCEEGLKPYGLTAIASPLKDSNGGVSDERKVSAQA